jgi:hypothetical protein
VVLRYAINYMENIQSVLFACNVRQTQTFFLFKYSGFTSGTVATHIRVC